MNCKYPWMLGVQPCACQGCIPCRVNKRSLWKFRMLLESTQHQASSFVTLTYSDENLPEGSSVKPSHMRSWLKRFRYRFEPRKIRYFLVGEYGDETGRPHYHGALFGIDPITAGGYDGQSGIVQESWGLGHTYVGTLTPDSAQYIAGYTMKKMTHDEEKCTQKCTHPPLNGRNPEFTRMSLKPGIGAGAMRNVADVYFEGQNLDAILSEGDVSSVLRIGNRTIPIGRYLKGELRKNTGICKESTEAQKKVAGLRMRRLLEEDLQMGRKKGKNPFTYWKEKVKQKALNVENRLNKMKKEKIL
jgi:hypothetical protein